MDNNLVNLEKFINFCHNNITGQERKEAQIFLDRFFQAFGYDGALEAGAKYEEAIKKGSKKKNTGFADLVWKPKLLIEMKKRGEDLSKHYPQAFDYWSRLVPDRPRYVILCNFDEFWIFDFDLQLDEPVDIVSIENLSKRYSAFNFMARVESKPIFKNNQVEVTEKAGRRLGELFQILQQRLISPTLNSEINRPPTPNFGGVREEKVPKLGDLGAEINRPPTPNSGGVREEKVPNFGDLGAEINRPPTPNSGGVREEKVPNFGDLGAEINRPPTPNSGGVREEKVPNFGDLGAEFPPNLGDKGGKNSQTLKIQRFILQCVLAMFAEDRGLLPNSLFLRCVEECLEGSSSYDMLGGLFREMNNKGVTPAGKYQGVDYFNGGLFSIVESIELTKPELEILATVARQDWSKIRPAIFGNIFEGTVNTKERHSHGMHYTSEADIMKIVRPTISKYWEELIDSANTIKELTNLQLKLQEYKILDPACGSGNFLYVAYQELKRIEHLLLDKIKTKNKDKNQQINISFVTPNQFYGMDINPFAVELAKVTLMIARKVAIDKFNLTEPALPLDSLDHNIICTDALFTDWIKADAIIGNPPFLGGKQMRLNLSDDYVERIFSKFKDVKDSVDFCSYWFRIAHDNLQENGRVGLVATNSISQGKSRKVSLDYIMQNKGYIHEAISTQPWSGEANVHVSIVNWCKTIPDSYILDNHSVKSINSSLTSEIDVTIAKKLKMNKNLCFQGIIPVGKSFYIDEKLALEWISNDSKNKDVLKLSVSADDLAKNPHGKPSRWIIDFNDLDLESACDYQKPFQHIKENVKPERDKNRDKKARENWWRFLRIRQEMREAIKNLSCYFAIPRHSKWFIFLPINSDYLPADSTVIVASEDFYILGILTSKIHRIWVKAQSSTLKGDTRYTNTTCFETFPFPDALNSEINRPPTPNSGGVKEEKVPNFGDLGAEKIVQQIRDKMIELHNYRTEQMTKKSWGITQLYNAFFYEPSSKLYQLHQQLDKLVIKAYNFDDNEDLLTQILALNLLLSK